MKGTHTRARLLWSLLLSLVMAASGWSPGAIAYALEGGDAIQSVDDPAVETPAMQEDKQGDPIEVDDPAIAPVDEGGAEEQEQPVAPATENEEEEGPQLSAQAIQAVAVIADTGQGYETLAEAVDAATSGQTIQMKADVNLENETLVVDKAITLDLNGCTVTGSISGKDTGVIEVNEMTLWIEDSVGGGAIVNEAAVTDADQSDAAGVYVAQEGTLNFTGGSVHSVNGSGVRVNGGDFTLTGGTVSGRKCGVFAADGRTQIAGGEVHGLSTEAGYYYGYGVYSNGGQVQFYRNSEYDVPIVTSAAANKSLGRYPNYGSFEIQTGKFSDAAANTMDGVTFVPTDARLQKVDEYYELRLTVTIDEDNGSPITTQYVEVGAKVSKPDEPTNQGLAFLGWFASDDATEPFDFSTPVNENLNLKARWAAARIEETGKTYGTLDEAVEAAQSGETVKLLANLTVTETVVTDKAINLDLNGCTVTGSISGEKEGVIAVADKTLWIEDSAGGGAIVNDGTFIDEDDDTVGVYVAQEGTLNFTGGSVHSVNGSGVRVNGGTFTLTGGTVSGRKCGVFAADGNAQIAGGEVSGLATEGDYGYGVYTNGGRVTFYRNDTYDVPIVTSAAANKSLGRYPNYGSFEIQTGKFSDAAANTMDGVTFVPTSAALLKDSGDEYFELYVPVTFDADNAEDDSDVSTVNVKVGATVDEREDPTKEGFAFIGWFDSAAATEPFDFSKPVNDALNLTARWGVARIEGTGLTYSTLADALTAAESDQTIQMLANVDLGGESFIVDKTIKLDLNGYMLSSASYNEDQAVVKVESGTLTVKDSSSNVSGGISNTYAGDIFANHNEDACGAYVAANAGLVLESGFVSSEGSDGVDVAAEGKFDMVGGSVGGGGYGISSSGETSISGGSVYGNNYGVVAYGNDAVVTISEVDSTSAPTITAGNKSVFTQGYPKSFTINGGRFGDDAANSVHGITLPEGMTLMKDEGEEYYTLQSELAHFGYSITLSDSIDITVNVKKLTKDPADYEIAYTFKNETTKATLTSPTLNKFVVASCSAKEMTEKVKVAVSYKGEVFKEATLSIQSYCDSAISKYGSSQKEKEKALADLCKATADYGSYAQKALNYNTDALANYGEDYFKNASIQVPESAPDVSGECDGITGRTLSLMTTSKTQLVVYFKHTKGLSMDGYTFTVGGQAVDAVDANNKFAVTVEGISAKDLDKRYDIAVKDGEGHSMTVNVGPLDYVSMAVAKGGQPEVNRALYNYYLKASAYFSLI